MPYEEVHEGCHEHDSIDEAQGQSSHCTCDNDEAEFDTSHETDESFEAWADGRLREDQVS